MKEVKSIEYRVRRCSIYLVKVPEGEITENRKEKIF